MYAVRCSLYLTCGVNTRNSTWGIHGFNLMGGVKPLSGINLDEDEWAMLTFNFTSMKEALGGKKDALKMCLHHLKMLQI